jgi:hypothetical protein
VNQAKRKYPAIDIVELYSKGHYHHWNSFLTSCYRNHDVERLKAALYGIQAGMTDAVDKKVSSAELGVFFIRLQRSLEQTAKKIFREKYPHPADDPLTAQFYTKHLEAKRKRDRAFEDFIRESSF